MRLSGNTILITGGTSGIGFELAAQLLKLGNVVIVTGRDQRKIEETQRELPGVRAFQSDVTDPKAIALLCDAVITEFPGLNMLFNNAGIMRETDLLVGRARGDLEDISREIETDLIGPIRMVKQFLPHLLRQPASAIVNVSSGLAFVPLPIAPIYCSAKAGLHSFTLSLRVHSSQSFRTGSADDANAIVRQRYARAGWRPNDGCGRDGSPHDQGTQK